MAYTLRATRFPLNLHLQYREIGTLPWHEGSIVNISRTGILFETRQDIPVQTALEMRVAFPPSVRMTLICRGPIVRKQEPISQEIRSVYAAPIRACRLLPRKTAKDPT